MPASTTRPAASGEFDGTDYFFVDDEGFDRMVADGELLEWAEVFHGHRYGTPRDPWSSIETPGATSCSRSTSKVPAGFAPGFPMR